MSDIGKGDAKGEARRPGFITGSTTQPMTAPRPEGRGGAFMADLRALPGRVSVRLRLTLLYGVLFLLAGLLLLFITHVLLAQVLDSVFPPGLQVHTPGGLIIETEVLKSRAMKELFGRSMLVLAGVGVMALVLGYFVADRALSPLQKVTATARRLSESTLHERIALEGPADEIKELADTFDAMLERLGNAFDAQRRFVANASHELRTPLAINRTLLEVALGDPEASPDLKAVGRTLLANNARHERLIEGLLLLARSERELTTRVPVDLAEVVTTVLKTLGDAAEEAGITVHTELASGTTLGDPVLLEHLVSNLVDNAIKHNTGEGGQVWVRAGVLDGSAAVQVENTGPVVPAYEVDQLFEPFRRLQQDRVESAKGSGLGLSIVRSVVRAHRGHVYATPRPGGGLVVTARMPLAS
ncbi:MULTISPECIES: sensor histidine kinase [Thermomonospora]|uniref:histidine kinase n=1 Tax=Thermomonospora curvata (strain ATCC 19995 / DSM 43183 / JCM 3096 / KCTC 9072 / NBRC 15933 / NCIMB 10081 / Henssen B9) TaxID=471852 RepID=D1AC04_THECD|nr:MULTISPECIES: HAMP domain-containing sensor histidine kinase [Thermomonospora]ACY97270.1 histidine kinase [Thermomonospora curvata DSM 43183]